MVSSTRKQRDAARIQSKPKKTTMSPAKRRKQIRAVQSKRSPKLSWDPKELFTVEYIASASLVKRGKDRVWKYEVKWWGYESKYNSHEFASQFAKCEYPILAHFWKSVGRDGNEPDPKRYKGKEVVFESPEGYRFYETGVTRKMARDHGQRGSKIGAKDSEEEVQQALSEDSDTSGEEFFNAYVKPMINNSVGFGPGRGKTY